MRRLTARASSIACRTYFLASSMSTMPPSTLVGSCFGLKWLLKKRALPGFFLP